MSFDSSYTRSFYFAIAFHLLFVFGLIWESFFPTTASLSNSASAPIEIDLSARETVKAVTVDAAAVNKTIASIKEAREKQKAVEKETHERILQEARQAEATRVQEQQRINQLKKEADAIALKKAQTIEKEKERLAELKANQEKEQKKLSELKQSQLALQKKQSEEKEKLATLNKEKIAAEKLKEKQLKEQAEKARQMAASQNALAEKRMADAKQDALNAENDARIMGEVDKYKAKILNAIGRQWILPEEISPELSSQFRIRLAPDGSVLSVSLSKSSGDPRLDRSAESAILKASPLPVPSDMDVFNVFRDITLTVRPENVRG
jgi:colicin import membrane protein